MRSRLHALGFLVLLLAIPARAADEPKKADEVVPGKVRLAIDPGHHVAPVYIVAFGPDSRTVYTADLGGTLQVWNVENGQRLRVIRLPLSMKDTIFAPFEPLPDGRRIAVNGGLYNDLRLHPPSLLDLETGAIIPLPVPDGTKHGAEVKASPDGKYLAGFQGPKGGVLLWRLDTPALPVLSASTVGLLGSPHGQGAFLAASALYPGRPDTTQGTVQLGIGKSTAKRVCFSQDSRLAVSCSDGLVRLWDLKGGVKSLPPLKQAEVHRIVWLPDGKHLLAQSQQALHYWDVDAGQMLRTWTAKDEKYNFGPTCARATGLLFHTLRCPREGTRVLATWGARVDGNVVVGSTLLDMATGEAREGRLIEHGTGGEVWGDISRDGKYAVTSWNRHIDVWPVDRPTDARRLNDGAGAIPDWFGLGNHTISWWEEKTPRVLKHALNLFRPADLVLKVLRVETRRVLGHVLDLAELELRSGYDGFLNLTWSSLELRGWKLTRVPKVNAFTVEHNGVKLPKLSVDYTFNAFLLAKGKDDVLLVSMDKNWWSIGLYDPARGSRVGTIEGKGFRFRPLAGSPDGRYLLTYSDQENMEIYSVEARKRLLSVYTEGEEWIAWTDGGYYASSPGGERMLGWLVQEAPNKIPTFHPAARFHKQMYRPDIIKLVLETGDVKSAIDRANKAAKKERAELPKLLPPFVEMELDKTKLPAEVTIRATARAAVKGQGVTALQLLLDGRPGPEVTFKDPVKMGEEATAQWTVKLPPGSHQLHVLARSPDSTSLSSVAQVNGPTAAAGARYKLHTLCVGVARYANNDKGGENKGLNLKYPTRDAKEVEAVFKQCCRDGKLYAAGQPKLLLDPDATTANVLAELNRLAQDKTLESGDLVVVFFSGHGERAEDGTLYLLTHEADRRDLKKTCLSGEKLKEALAKVPCRVLLLLDACHASAIGPPYRVTTELAMLLNQEDCGAAVIAAARSKEFALEEVKDRNTGKVIENGLFTWAMKEALGGKAKADDHDHRVYIHDLYQYVFSEVRYQSNGRQTPCLGAPLGGKPVALIERSPK